MDEVSSNGTSADDQNLDPAAKLVAQLYYDRADVARISCEAAAAMDLVIAMVLSAVRKRQEHPD